MWGLIAAKAAAQRAVFDKEALYKSVEQVMSEAVGAQMQVAQAVLAVEREPLPAAEPEPMAAAPAAEPEPEPEPAPVMLPKTAGNANWLAVFGTLLVLLSSVLYVRRNA